MKEQEHSPHYTCSVCKLISGIWCSGIPLQEDRWVPKCLFPSLRLCSALIICLHLIAQIWDPLDCHTCAQNSDQLYWKKTSEEVWALRSDHSWPKAFCIQVQKVAGGSSCFWICYTELALYTRALRSFTGLYLQNQKATEIAKGCLCCHVFHGHPDMKEKMRGNSISTTRRQGKDVCSVPAHIHHKCFI